MEVFAPTCQRLLFRSLLLPRHRYHNYRLFSFVPVQERLSGRVLTTAYLGAVGLWIPVAQYSLNDDAAIYVVTS